jgi:hypothetical protein
MNFRVVDILKSVFDGIKKLMVISTMEYDTESLKTMRSMQLWQQTSNTFISPVQLRLVMVTPMLHSAGNSHDGKVP